MMAKWNGPTSGEYILYSNLSGGAHYAEATFSQGGTTQKDIFPAGNARFQMFTSAWKFLTVGYDGPNQLARLQAVYDSGGGIFAVDTQTVSCTGMVGTAEPFIIGNYSGLVSGWWGNLDEIGFWGRLLTDAEVIMLYNAGNGLPFSSFT
jgi:hypothetical protein